MIKPRKAVLEMQEYKPPTSGREDFLRLDFNENTLGCSPKVMEALKKEAFHYPLSTIYPVLLRIVKRGDLGRLRK